MERGKLFRLLLDANTPKDLWRVTDIVEHERAEAHGGSDPRSLLYAADSVVLFGAGEYARAVLASWLDKMPRVRYLVDSNPSKWGGIWCGLPVLRPSELSGSLGPSLVVVAAMDTNGIEATLQSIGITPLFAEQDGSVGYLPGNWLIRHQLEFAEIFESLADDISRTVLLSVSKGRLFQGFNFPMKGNWFTAQCSTHPQYFPENVVELRDEESFLDCGAFDGDTVIDFASQMWRRNLRGWSALALEGDAENVKQTRDNLIAFGLETVPVLHAVLGASQDSSIIHNCRGPENSRTGPAIRLDDVHWEKPPTYIKMDIEGAELEAIKSGKEMLMGYCPKLAICLYHRSSDLLQIPLYIQHTHGSYRLYIRHHRSGSLWETVCYAISN